MGSPTVVILPARGYERVGRGPPQSWDTSSINRDLSNRSYIMVR